MTFRSRVWFVAVALSFVVLIEVGFVRLAVPQSPVQPRPPAPPRVYLDTAYTPPTGRTIAVKAGGDLQAALNSAQPGDVLTLAPGATFQGTFTLPRKSGTGWIVVRSAAPDDKLPSPGTRITPAFADMMPKIVTLDQNSAVQTAPGASHYRFIGVEFTAASSVKMLYQLVAFGGQQATEAETPHDLILDRCYVHGRSDLMSRRGVLLNSAASAVIDSHVSEIHASGYDSQAILGYNGPGPFKISNNFLEGATENIMFGGADPSIRGLVPSDIEISRNHVFKPPSWLPGNPAFAGINWALKNLIELKNAQRVLIDANLLENSSATALVLTPRNQNGSAPWSVVQDVTFQNNVIRNSVSGFVALSTDNEHPSQPTRRIAIVNNLWLGISRTFFGMSAGPGGFEDIVVDHNTAMPDGHSTYYVEAGGPPAVARFRFTNNLVGFGAYGVTFPTADPNLAKMMPDAIILRNALVSLGDIADGQGATRNRPPGINQTMYMSYPSAGAAGLQEDGTLTTKSPNRGAGLDKKDIGVDFNELQRAGGGRFSRR